MSGAIWVLGEASGAGLARSQRRGRHAWRPDLGAAAGREVVGVVAGAGPDAAADGARPASCPGSSPSTSQAQPRPAVAAAVAPALAALIEREAPGLRPRRRDPRRPRHRRHAGGPPRLGRPRQRERGGLDRRRAGGRDERVRRPAPHDERIQPPSTGSSRSGRTASRPARRARRARSNAVSIAAGHPLPVVRVARPGRRRRSAAAPIEEARVIVAGGRGVGGPDGFRVVEDLADALGGAVGATRAAVDAGWIPYSQQIGQTGKIVKPDLYVALGISGAIQHKVGMQTASTIVAVNRDPDAPIAEFADLVVIGDLFEVAPAIAAELRSRTDLRHDAGRAHAPPDRHPARRLRGPRRRADRRRPAGRQAPCPQPARRRVPGSVGGTCRPDRPLARWGHRPGRLRSVATSSRPPPSPRTSRRPRTRSRATRTRPRRCRRHPARSTPRDSLTIELSRAGRALEMVAHGCSLLARLGRSDPRARGPDVDQARLPQPPPRPRGDQPHQARDAAASIPPRRSVLSRRDT